MFWPSLQIVTEGKSNSVTGFEIVFKLVIVLSPFQSVKMLLAKIAADIRAKITKIDHITLVKWEFFSRYWIPEEGENYSKTKKFYNTTTLTMNRRIFCIAPQKVDNGLGVQRSLLAGHISKNGEFL